MSKIGSAIYELHHMESLAKKDQWINRIYPLVKLVLTVFYIALVVSFPKYALAPLLLMGVYPIALFILGDLSVKDSVRRLRFILPFVCVVGIFQPFLDRTVLFTAGPVPVTGGVVSMLTLLFKGFYSVFASYLLIATTTIEKLCLALRKLHVPEIFVTQVLLTYRYISVLLEEAHRIMQAYALRAPGQKGVHFRVWGSLAGQLLLRSMDRASSVYESMTMRGYRGEFAYASSARCRAKDYAYLLFWSLVFVFVRYAVL